MVPSSVTTRTRTRTREGMPPLHMLHATQPASASLLITNYLNKSSHNSIYHYQIYEIKSSLTASIKIKRDGKVIIRHHRSMQ